MCLCLGRRNEQRSEHGVWRLWSKTRIYRRWKSSKVCGSSLRDTIDTIESITRHKLFRTRRKPTVAVLAITRRRAKLKTVAYYHFLIYVIVLILLFHYCSYYYCFKVIKKRTLICHDLCKETYLLDIYLSLNFFCRTIKLQKMLCRPVLHRGTAGRFASPSTTSISRSGAAASTNVRTYSVFARPSNSLSSLFVSLSLSLSLSHTHTHSHTYTHWHSFSHEYSLSLCFIFYFIYLFIYYYHYHYYYYYYYYYYCCFSRALAGFVWSAVSQSVSYSY
jgi:hypothetical protein